MLLLLLMLLSPCEERAREGFVVEGFTALHTSTCCDYSMSLSLRRVILDHTFRRPDRSPKIRESSFTASACPKLHTQHRVELPLPPLALIHPPLPLSLPPIGLASLILVTAHMLSLKSAEQLLPEPELPPHQQSCHAG